MRPLLAFAGLLLLVAFIGCSGDSADHPRPSSPAAGQIAATTGTSPGAPAIATGASDGDDADDARNDHTRGEHEDDVEVTGYGHPASAKDIRTATAFAKRYFAAAAAEDGAAVCSLIVPKISRGIAVSYGKEPHTQGRTCAEVMSKLLAYNHERMAAEAAQLAVTGMRVANRSAAVLLFFKGLGERRYLGVERTGNTWRMEDLLDSEYP